MGLPEEFLSKLSSMAGPGLSRNRNLGRFCPPSGEISRNGIYSPKIFLVNQKAKAFSTGKIRKSDMGTSC